MQRLIDRYLDGELTANEADELLAALRDDPELAVQLRGWERMLAAMGDLGAVAPSPGFASRVMERVRLAAVRRPPARIAPPRQRSPWAWAALLVLAFGGGFLAANLAPVAMRTPDGRAAGSARFSPASAGGEGGEPSGALLPVRLVYAAEEEHASSVSVAGSFNGWNHVLTPLRREGRIWTTLLLLPPGSYEYMFVLDGREWRTDPLALQTRDDGFGRRNAILELPL